MAELYDDAAFFAAYARMDRSERGLEGAGEWPQMRALLPKLSGLRVLDLGCGYGWHCRYCAEQGAASVLGLDSSRSMLEQARRRNAHARVTYRLCGMERFGYPASAYDLVLSNLALHYLADLNTVYRRVSRTLAPGGTFLLNMEHPVFTAGVGQTWAAGPDGRSAFWPVDGYFFPGPRRTVFLGQTVEKQHHTLTQILMGLLDAGLRITAGGDPQPPEAWRERPGMEEEMRRPMMLLVRAEKPADSGEGTA